MSLDELQVWLDGTSLSESVKEVTWIIPLLQSVHILAIAVVMAAVLLVNLRLADVFARREPLRAMWRRYVPSMWIALLVLALSGAVLIVGEPGRTLSNPVFGTKMALLAAAVATTLVTRRAALQGGQGGAARLAVVHGLSWTALALWVGIVFCGRWIAYV